MWVIVEYLVFAAIVLISITEFFYPLLTQKPLFGSFRKKTTEEPKPKDNNPLNEKISEVKVKVQEVKEEVKEVQNEVSENFDSAKKLKKDSDNLLK